MLRKLIAVLLICAVPSTVLALASSAAPTKIQIPFANSAGGAYVRTVPVASQIGIQNGAASYTDGFPPLNFTPISAGGVPPFGQDMNGILRDVSAHARWWAAGGPVRYDSAYQTAIGGYPLGSIVQSATVTGRLWVSTTENNVTNPDTGGAGWTHPTLGSDQNWTPVTRTNGVTYTNSTGRPIQVSVMFNVGTVSSASISICITSPVTGLQCPVTETISPATLSQQLSVTTTVPSGHTYVINCASIASVSELR